MKKLLIITFLALNLLASGCSFIYFDDDTHLSFDNSEELAYYQDKFYYQQLNDYEKAIYESVFHASIENLDSIDIGLTYDLDEISFAIDSFGYDWPEFFSFKESSIYDNSKYITLVPDYLQETIDASELRNDLLNLAMNVVIECKADNDYETIKNIHDYLINNVTYVSDSEYNEDIRSVFYNYETDCSGFSYAFQYLCNLASIECYSVIGIVEPYEQGEQHQWNMVNLNGNYYYIDVTWDDLTDEDGNKNGVSYEYFLCCDEIINVDHSLVNTYSYPVCNDKTYYCLDMPAMFCDEFDKQLITNNIVEWINQGYSTFYFKCINENVYDDVLTWLYEDGGFANDIYQNYISYYYDLTTSVSVYDNNKFIEFSYIDNY